MRRSLSPFTSCLLSSSHWTSHHPHFKSAPVTSVSVRKHHQPSPTSHPTRDSLEESQSTEDWERLEKQRYLSWEREREREREMEGGRKRTDLAELRLAGLGRADCLLLLTVMWGSPDCFPQQSRRATPPPPSPPSTRHRGGCCCCPAQGWKYFRIFLLRDYFRLVRRALKFANIMCQR